MKLLEITSDVQNSLGGVTLDNRESVFQESFFAELVKLSPEEIITLRKEYSECLRALRGVDGLREYFRSNYDAVGDDSFDDFCCWIISMGKDCYKDVTEGALKLDMYAKDFDEGFYFESFGYVFAKAFEELTGDDINDVL